MTDTQTEQRMCRPATCKTCPFRGGFHLNHARRVDIHQAVTVRDETFHCHSEVDYDDDDSEGDTYNARQCAGATTLLTRTGSANQAMRWGERISGETFTEDPNVPFESWADWVNEPDFSIGAPERTNRECCGGECDGHTCEVVDVNCECPAGWDGGSGVAENTERLTDPVFCSACGDAMCGPCTGPPESGGDPLCTICASWEDDE